MRTNVMTTAAGGLLLMAGLAGCSTTSQTGSAGAMGAADDGEVTLTLDQVPANVRATILKHTSADAITEIELDTEDGVAVYDVEVAGGSEFMVAPSGDYLGVEKDDEDGDD